MIVRSIRVQNWRCFIDPVTIGPFSEGLNILFAPNASGKSTIFEALRRAILDSHRVRGKEVEAIRPWGRILSPCVKVELVYEGMAYRVTKRFLDNPLAVLEREENGRFVRLAEGAAADEMIRKLITRNPPGRGLARQDNWGLAQVLWAPQGDLSFARLSGDVLEDIKKFLGAHVAGADTGILEKRIEQEYLKFFTPGGKLRSGKDAPKLKRLQKQLKEAREKLTRAISHQQQYEELVRKVEDLRSQRIRVKFETESIIKSLEKARKNAEIFTELTFKRKQQESRAKAAEAQFNELKQHIENIKSAEKELIDVESKISAVKKEISLKKEEVKLREKEETTAGFELEKARRSREDIDRLVEIADEAKRFTENKRKLAELQVELERIKAIARSLETLQSEKSKLVAPDANTLKAIRKKIKQRDEATLLLDASLIRLEITPQEDCLCRVLAGEQSGEVHISAGELTRIQGAPEVVVDIPAFGTIRAMGPAGSVEEHRKTIAILNQELARLTEPFGTDNLAALEKLYEDAVKLDKKYSKIETELRTLLKERDITDLEHEIFRLSAALENTLKKHPDWEENLPDVAELEKEAQRLKHSCSLKINQCEVAWDTARRALTRSSMEQTALVQRLEDLEEKRKLLRSRLDKLTGDGKDDGARYEELRRYSLEWEAAKAELGEIEEKLGEFSDDPRKTVKRLETKLEEFDRISNQALEEEKNAEGRLEQLASQGTYSNLALIEEEIASLKREKEAEELRVYSIKLIHDTLSKCRSQAISAVVGPVEKRATETLKRIAGRKLGGLNIGESFEPQQVIPELADSPVPLDSVSGGEKEQIYFATRLALAEVLAKEERQLAVFDDVLIFTDAGRFARVLNILEEASEKLQVLILTCHPERYRGLEKARFIDLEKAIEESEVV